MTDTATVLRNDYTGNGVATTFPYTFKALSESELLVTQRDTSGVETVLTPASITGIGVNGGGSVVLSSALTSGYTLSITPNPTIKQPLDIRNASSLYRDSIESALDRACSINKMQQDALNRSIRAPVSENADLEIPSKEIRANSTLYFDENGDVSVGQIPAEGVISPAMQPVVGAITLEDAIAALGPFDSATVASADGGTQRTLMSRFSDAVNVRDHGAVCDGVTDDSAALQAALNRGKPVVIDAEAALYIGSQVTVTGSLHLSGGGTLIYPRNVTPLSVEPAPSNAVTVTASTTGSLFNSYIVSVITAPGHGAAVGDVFLMYSQDALVDDSTGKQGELFTVTGIVGNDIYASKVLRDTYTTSPKIQKLSSASVVIDGITFKGDGDIEGAETDRARAALQLVGCVAPRIRARFTNGWSRGLFVISCMGGMFDIQADNLADAPAKNAYGYAVSCACASSGGEYRVNAQFVRHAFTTNVYTAVGALWYGEPDGAKVTGSARYCTAAAWDTHVGAHKISFIGCTTVGSVSRSGSNSGVNHGAQNRSRNTAFVGCVFTDVSTAITDSSPHTSQGESYTAIMSCVIDNTPEFRATGRNTVLLNFPSGSFSYAANCKVHIGNCTGFNCGLGTLSAGHPEVTVQGCRFVTSGAFRDGGGVLRLFDVVRENAIEPVQVANGTTLSLSGYHAVGTHGGYFVSTTGTGTATVHMRDCTSETNLLQVDAGTLNVDFFAYAVTPVRKVISTLTATPNVSGCEIAVIDFASAQNITGFSSTNDGDSAWLFFNTANATLVNSASFKLAGAVNYTPTAGSSVRFYRYGSVWYETSRAAI